TIADALERAQAALKTETRKLERVSVSTPGRTDEGLKNRTQIESHVAALREQVNELRSKSHNGTRTAKMMLPDAPKIGTGFCIGDGYIVTTADVVQGMSVPIVVTDTGSRIKATVVSCDKELNVGLLKLPAQA